MPHESGRNGKYCVTPGGENGGALQEPAQKLLGIDADAQDEKETEAWEKRNLRYGWGRWTPECLQVFNRISWYVFWVCLFSLFQGFIVNGVINAVITTLESRFELPSSKSGLVASSNDFLALFLVLVVSFYGSSRHKPKVIGIGVIVLGVGSFIFAIPHFATEQYNYNVRALGDFENVCRPGNNSAADCVQVTSLKSSLTNFLYVFMLANALHGAGSTPMYVLGTTFIDENTRAEQTPFFLGIIYCVAALGVAGGYMGGGQFLNLYTDIDKVDTSSLDITPMDPRWVGAWWMPFLINGALMLIIAIPILGYPKRLPGSAKLQRERVSEAISTGNGDTTVQRSEFGKSWRDFPKEMFDLARNRTFLFLSLGSCTEGLIISGVATFGAKFLQEKFNIPAAFAGFMMGIITVPGAGGGMLLGGFIVKKRKLKARGIIRFNMIAAVLALCMGFIFLMQCPVQNIAGVTKQYVTQSEHTSPSNLYHACNHDCGCQGDTYEPVCGLDGAIYFSPCHAGCDGDFDFMMGPMGPFKFYKNCSCVATSMMHKFMSMNQSSLVTTALPTTTVAMDVQMTESPENITGPPIGAYQGVCMSDCKLLYTVVPFLFVGMLFTFMTCSPTQTATLRVVQENQRSLAIGFQWLFLRLLGTMPGPLLLGTIMDSACQVWQDLCGEPGKCWIYQKTGMGVKLFVWWLCVKFVTLVFYFLAHYFYKPPKNGGRGDTSKEENEDKYVLKNIDDSKESEI